MAKIYDGQLVYLICNRTLSKVILNTIISELIHKKLLVIPPFHIYGEVEEHEPTKRDYYEFEFQKAIINDCNVALCIQTLEPCLDRNTQLQIEWAKDFCQSAYDLEEAFPEVVAKAREHFEDLQFTSNNWQQAFG